jgi:Zn-dependent protease
MFLLTCAATFWAGATREMSGQILAGYEAMKDVLREGWWQNGLVYMSCVMATLLAHEMGHFVMTVRYRIRATLPLFLPLPITPIGTMGAVIAMQGSAANRKQLFDIGIAAARADDRPGLGDDPVAAGWLVRPDHHRA